MQSTALLIDGQNFKAKVASIFEAAGQPRPQWHQYNFQRLFEIALSGSIPALRFFYSARIKEHPQTRKKSRQLILEQRLLKTHLERQGVTVILSGRVRGYTENGVIIFKEKGVDVKIAVDMMSLTCDRVVNEIILASSDSDLQPAVQEIKRRGVQCTYLGFEHQMNKGLKYTTDRTIVIHQKDVLHCLNAAL